MPDPDAYRYFFFLRTNGWGWASRFFKKSLKLFLNQGEVQDNGSDDLTSGHLSSILSHYSVRILYNQIKYYSVRVGHFAIKGVAYFQEADSSIAIIYPHSFREENSPFRI